jgi:hypothetical protein
MALRCEEDRIDPRSILVEKHASVLSSLSPDVVDHFLGDHARSLPVGPLAILPPNSASRHDANRGGVGADRVCDEKLRVGNG